jgi:predicted nucleic acid-binding protein
VILVDTNVLVALVDERDRLHSRAKHDLKVLAKAPFACSTLVLGEACFLLQAGFLRQRLRLLLKGLAATPVELEDPFWDEVFDWLERYDEHEPDLADAQLAILSSRNPEWRVWTYDDEFRTTWRRSDGSKIPTVGRSRSK